MSALREEVVRLSEKLQRGMLFLARQSIADCLFGTRSAAVIDVGDESPEANCGVFVTLSIGDALRGCIGVVESHESLRRTVHEMSIAAATRDPRFPPLHPSELILVDIEISVLSSFREIATIAEIVVNEHGLLVRSGHQQGLLLPQVAAKAGWDARQFLEAACKKAGVDAALWPEGKLEVSIFHAHVFAEKDFSD